jgi:hypothetical protein
MNNQKTCGDGNADNCPGCWQCFDDDDGLHRNLISDTEDEARDDLLAGFESALDDLIADGLRQADKVGGYFRGPGIRKQMTDLLLEKTRRAR